jgi:hypothetical protein
MAKSRKLKGRGVGPSKVAPAPEEPVEESVYTYETLPASERQALQMAEWKEITKRLSPLLESEDEDIGLGVIEYATSIQVAKKDGEIVAVRVNGDKPEDSVVEYPVIYPKNFDGEFPEPEEEDDTQEAESDFKDLPEGSSRRRVKKQTRRTKRNRRNLKGKKLRKLTARRR